MNRACLIFADGEDCAGDHCLQLALRHADAFLRVDIRKLGVVVGRKGSDGERRNAALDRDLEVLVDMNAHGIVRQFADDIKKQPGRHDARAVFLHVGIDAHGDACFQIITGQHHFDTCTDQNTFQPRDGALLRDGARGDGDGGNQLVFFTGKFHKRIPPDVFLKRKKG